MIKPSLVRSYILLSIFITVGVLFVGFVSSNYLTHIQREHERLSQPPPNMLSFVARLMDQFDSVDHRQAFEKVKTSFEKGVFTNFWLVDKDGNILASTGNAALPLNFNSTELPIKEYESAFVGRPPGLGMGPPPPGPPPLFGFGGPPKGPPGPPPSEIVRLKNDPPTYIVAEFRPRGSQQRNDALIFQASLFLSIITASLLTFGAISWHVRRKALMAAEVMSRMQNGDLKARFPVHRHDEIGRIMLLFNTMGDEIERLVEKIKHTEKSRVFILQELAHDLRTPIASLKSMLETLEEGENIPQKLHEELMHLSLEEVNYFARLVEDLLLLAQVLEPQYQSPFQPVPWFVLLGDEVAKINLQQSTRETPKRVRILAEADLQNSQIMGDENLLRRVFKNTLQNAITYAKSDIEVKVERDVTSGQLIFHFSDDGPGFSPELMSSYGERKVSRYINTHEGGQLSVGLGSVIIKKVVLAHKGSLLAHNLTDEAGNIHGAEVVIRLPLA